LQPIRHAGATDDERLRILFVALTRARNGLYLTSAAHTFSGKPTKRLKYFDEREQDDGSVKALVLPEHAQAVQSEDADAPVTELLELDWRTRHIGGLRDASLASLLSERTENYCFSPTHLTSFVDLQYGGPQQFFFDKLLKFPGTPSPDSQFGIAIHDALEWYQNQLNEHGYAPSTDETIEHFALRLKSRKLTEQRAILELERGQLALSAFLAQRASIFKPGDIAEKDFHSEGVSYGDIRMDGRIDRLEVDPSNRQITIVDYKTGKSYSQWKQEMPLHKHQLQLYAYKLLAAGSRSYREYNVTAGRLEFIESDEGGRIDSLELRFNDDELERVRVLVKAIATHVRELNFPDVSAYPVSLTGMKAFEQDLIDGKI
jgi:RecB family exonuclease